MKFRSVFIGAILCITGLVGARAEHMIDGGQITGHIFDKKSKSSIEYATIAVYNVRDSSLVTGTISDSQGGFTISKIESGTYYVMVNFLGYEELRYNDIVIERSGSSMELGQIYLETASQKIEEVEITNERNAVEFKIDKKVVSVGEHMTAASLTAVEVLENVTSIRVDIEGNVSLRGSTGFTVLIDGKPTALDPSDVLRQTPASTIENIEIITNPSAKYQPDGTGGIINIITKKNRMQGLQGLFNAKAGSFGMYSGDFLLNYKTGKVNFYLGGDYGYSPSPGVSSTERRITQNDTTTVIETEGDTERIRDGAGLRLGVAWDPTPKDNLTIGVSAGAYEWSENSLMDYLTYRDPFDYSTQELSLNESARRANIYNLTSSFRHQFEKKDHDIVLQLNYSIRTGDDYSQNLLMDSDGFINNGARTTEEGPASGLEFKLDYSKPLGEKNDLEAGLHLRSSSNDDAADFYEYDVEQDDFILQIDKSNQVDYLRNVYAVYGIFKGEAGKLGYQAGLRGEYTYRDVNAEEELEDYAIERFDYFPTLHLSYQLPKENQLMASYSRRIDRPRGWYLEPFETWKDIYNVERGNPALEPEYIDAMEFAYIGSGKNSQFSSEIYYRIKHNKIERIQSVYDEGILLHTYDNVGTDYSLGLETIVNLAPFPWWEFNVMGNLYDYRIESVRNGTPYEYHSFNWGARLNNTFNIAKRVRLQFDSNYNSATITTQGEDKGYYSFNAAVRTDFLDRKLSLVLQVRDVFSTLDRISVNHGVGFYNYQYRSSNAPVFALTVSYRLNNFKQNKKLDAGEIDSL